MRKSGYSHCDNIAMSCRAGSNDNQTLTVKTNPVIRIGHDRGTRAVKGYMNVLHAKGMVAKQVRGFNPQFDRGDA